MSNISDARSTGRPWETGSEAGRRSAQKAEWAVRIRRGSEHKWDILRFRWQLPGDHQGQSSGNEVPYMGSGWSMNINISPHLQFYFISGLWIKYIILFPLKMKTDLNCGCFICWLPDIINSQPSGDNIPYMTSCILGITMVSLELYNF